MGAYDNFKDMPEQIKKEGQDISLTYTRNGDGTATICWNIPKPAIGCSADNQAYDGIVITVASKAVNYTSTSPVDGTYYNADTSVDLDINLGDKLDYAHVVGAFYHDKTTKCITVSDVLDKTPYYFSAYAVDKVGRYHREGVHAYSLPLTMQSFVGDEGSHAAHDIEIDGETITGTSLTGLVDGSSYDMSYKFNNDCFDISILGADALTYDELITALNIEFSLHSTSVTGTVPPNAGGYHVDETNAKLYLWDGFTQTVVSDAVFWEFDPSIPVLGTIWYNPDLDTVFRYETSGWSAVSAVIKHGADPRTPVCDDIWFDGTDIWQWDGTIWCKLPTIISGDNPLLPPNLNCNTYWYDSGNDVFNHWNDETSAWDNELVVVSEKDPNNITTGDFWYNETDEKVYIYLASDFNELNNIRYEEADETGELPLPVANHYWYEPSTQRLRKRNVSNTAWVDHDLIFYPTDPTDRDGCDLWWDVSISVNELYKWDELNSVWSPIGKFFESSIDPSLPILLEDNTAWYNPDIQEIELIMGTNCLPVTYIYSLTDPTVTDVGDIWYNTTTSLWYEWDGLVWILTNVIEHSSDPYTLISGTFWFDTINDLLFEWNGSIWVTTLYSVTPLFPLVGTKWFNTTSNLFFEWNGTSWVEINSDVYVQLILNRTSCDEGKNVLCFMTRDVGCNLMLQILKENNTVITGLTSTVIWYDPIEGSKPFEAALMSDQLGVGTDGSPDERRGLQAEIRMMLGKSSTEVELAKVDVDLCITNAIRKLRKGSSYAYTRGFFFLDVNPNQQNYILGGKCVGFNKIAYVNQIYRTGNLLSAGGNGSGENSVFTFGALQQLFALSTFDILSYHLVASYLEELDVLFARHILHDWVEHTRELRMYQVFHSYERVLLDVSMEKTEQTLIKDRETIDWIQRWGVAEGKMILSQIRGKFQTLPGPNGSTTLNSQELITQAESEKAELIDELNDMGMQDVFSVGLGSHLVIG